MLNRNLNIALIEDNITWGDKQANLTQLEENLKKMPEGIDLVVLPELFTTGFITGDKDQAMELAERNSGETMQRLHALAQEYSTAFCGSFLAATAGQLSILHRAQWRRHFLRQAAPFCLWRGT